MNNEIKIPTTRYHKIVNLLSMILIIGIFAYLILNWNQIPDSVPGHFNGAGEIDRWGSKYELFLCPSFALGIYALISFLEKYPTLWNTGVTVTKANQTRVYCILKNMIVTLKFTAVLVLVSITFYSVLSKPLSKWFLPVCVVLTFAPMVYFLVLLYKKK